MSTLTNYGSLNEHMLGILMKELARRAVEVIRAKRFLFEQYTKESYNPAKEGDLYTNADIAAQNVYVKSLRECTPNFGIIGEEDSLQVPCSHPEADIYWTVDPLDGTRAFTRRQSHGIGTMLSLVCNDKVIAAVVGDIISRELFYFRPGSTKVHRISDFATDEILEINQERSLRDQYLLLRDPLPSYLEGVQALADSESTSSLFKSYQITDGSIGTMMARLWKGEIGAVALRPGVETPWDSCPVMGLSEAMGFTFWEGFRESALWWQKIKFHPSRAVHLRGHDLLIIHKSRLTEFREWCQGMHHQIQE